MNDYPPGVPVNEFGIATIDYEEWSDIPCPALRLSVGIECNGATLVQGYGLERWRYCLDCGQTTDLSPLDGPNPAKEGP